jgi:bifunctional pyridoxal-dependent enzyme with beta-cystathionase and maltose regulon repressor activities
MNDIKNDEKREKFIKFAEKRVNNAIKAISLIGNLANKNNYRYGQNDVDKILKALRSEMAELEACFKTQRSKEKSFTL